MTNTILPDKIESARLLLRVPRHGDGLPLNEAVRETFEQLHRWMPWAHSLPTLSDSEAYVREAGARFRSREEYPLLVFERSSGRLVGACGMHHIDWGVPRFEIGYWLRTSAQGQGYMTECVGCLAQFAFMRLKAERLEIRCDADNDRSAAVAQRAGFTLEVRMRHERRNALGQLCDTLVFVKFP